MTRLKDLHIKIIACVLGCVLHVYVTSLKRKEKKKKKKTSLKRKVLTFTFSCKPTKGKYRLILATAWSLHFCASSFGNAIELN